MPDLYQLLADLPTMTPPAGPAPTPPPPNPGTHYTASVETIDNDRSGVLLGALNI